MYWVYILKCCDNGFYVGCTDDIKNRIERHKNGYVNATKYRLPVVLYCYFCFRDKYIAFDFEKYYKNWVWKSFCKKNILVFK